MSEDQQKKTSREIAEEICGNEFETRDLVEQAIQAERNETNGLRHELKMLQACVNEEHLDTVKLREENMRLRNVLVKLKAGPGNNMSSWKLTWAYQFSSKALSSIPETDKYARLREIEKEIVRVARRMHLGFEKDIATVPNSYPASDLKMLFQKLDVIQKELGDG